MPKVFVSYARGDKEIVQALVHELQELGYEAFYDQNLSGGQRWWEVLLDQIQSADGFLPVLSSEYRHSEACHREAKWAESLNIPFVPIDLGQASPDLFEKVVAEANWVHYSLDDRASVARLARALGAMRKPELPSPLPQRPSIPISYFAELEREIRTFPTIPLERQLAIIVTLRAKLNTREDGSARIMLGELRNRTDITYSNAVDIDRMLASVPAGQPAAPPADTRYGPAQPPPPAYPRLSAPQGTGVGQPPNVQPPGRYPGSDSRGRPPGYEQAAHRTTSTAAPSLASPLRFGIFGVGLLLIVLALFAVDWINVSGASLTVSVNYGTLHRHIGSTDFGLAIAYFKWLGYVLTVLIIALTAASLLVRRRPKALMLTVIVAALLNVIITVVATVGELNRGKQQAGAAHLSYGAGLFLMVFGVILVTVGALLPRRS